MPDESKDFLGNIFFIKLLITILGAVLSGCFAFIWSLVNYFSREIDTLKKHDNQKSTDIALLKKDVENLQD